jgi:transcriptional regulator with XRE-family HTH domain
VIVEIEENPNKRHRRTIKLSDKVEIIRLIEHGQTQSDVARSLGISQSTVQTIWSNKSDILERNQSPKKKRKNLHWKKYSTIDQALFNWYRQCRDTGVVVDGKMILDKSIEFAEYYKQPEFKAQAQRWLDMFKRRHNLSDLDRQDRLQLAAAASLALDQHQHLQQIMNSSSVPPPQPQQQHAHSHIMTHVHTNNHELVPDFDLSSLPSLMAGLYPPDPSSTPGTPPQSIPPQLNNNPPNFNSHLPAVPVMGGPVTTCDAMKYVELTRSWITSTFGENEELLNNHLNAIENAILKRRMTEMLTPNNSRSQ